MYTFLYNLFKLNTGMCTYILLYDVNDMSVHFLVSFIRLEHTFPLFNNMYNIEYVNTLFDNLYNLRVCTFHSCLCCIT